MDAAAMRLFEETLGANPDLARDQEGRIGLAAACVAARAGTRPAPEGSAGERARWRLEAVVWLRAAFDVVKGLDPKRQYPNLRLGNWLAHPDLAGIRDEAALKELPDGEAADLRAFWDEVRQVQKKLLHAGD
jgi:hypothetical protein